MTENYKRLNYNIIKQSLVYKTYKMSSYYPPYKSSSSNIKVELDLSNYATKTDLKNITHTDVSSLASKTNLAALKTEVDKIYVDKLKTVPDDLAKLSNVVKNEVVKKTDTNALDDKIDKIDKKIPDVSGLATKSSVTILVKNLDDRIDKSKNDYAKKTSLTNYVLTTDFNSKSTELENKIKDADIIAKSAVTKVNSIKSDLNDYAKKADVANGITTIKNDYVSNASLTSRLNDLKSQHIATEVKTINDKTKKNGSDILSSESRLKQKEDIIDDVQRENALTNGRDYYHDKMYLLYECKAFSFKYASGKITSWKSTGMNNYTKNSNIDVGSVATTSLPPLIDSGRMSVRLEGAYFKQMRLLRPNNDNIVNIYIVYLFAPISNSRNTDYTVQNALFGGARITKNATDTSKHKYEGYGICFDEGGMFSMGKHGRNVLIFGVRENSVIHSNNKANKMFVMGDGFVQGTSDTTLHAEKI